MKRIIPPPQLSKRALYKQRRSAVPSGGRTRAKLIAVAITHPLLHTQNHRFPAVAYPACRAADPKVGRRKMTVGAGIAVQDGSLVALGAKILREVRGNVLVTPAAGGGLTNGAFLGVRSAPGRSRSIFPVGKLRYVRAHSSALPLYFCL